MCCRMSGRTRARECRAWSGSLLLGLERRQVAEAAHLLRMIAFHHRRLRGRKHPAPAAGAPGAEEAAAVQRLLDETALRLRSEEHTSELQSLTRISYAVLCIKLKHLHTSALLLQTSL